jgi:predicted NodU family carbamoyl transferase
MNILGFNPSHHGSVCLLQDGELKFFIQEERVGNREKYTAYPFRSFIDILQNYKIDYITWGTPSMLFPISLKTTFPYWLALAIHIILSQKALIFQTLIICHAAHSFYNSGFKECNRNSIDGVGSEIIDAKEFTRETETIFQCSYPNNLIFYIKIKLKYKMR